MVDLSRRRVLLLSLTLPLGIGLAGCESNPNGPTFPTLPAEKNAGDAAGGPGEPATKGRKKKNPMGMINDPAA
ncbi:hypothetical protein [Paludisphaera rhizosphaerae]|uniref:hypothetical protein n=1 Tax=Paludisphaera rhizosphaerae TaxID=2711216 RepID=UPI0013EAA2AC|nr:hypothetical protein [Paludisphaera rhizosphaerae]